jgi:hypothetical protein
MAAFVLCLVSFAMPLGNLVGMATMSAMFTNKSNVGEQDTKDGIRSTIWTYKKGAWEFDAKDGMMWAFIVMLLVMWRCVLLTLSLGNFRILTDGGQEVVSEINEPPPRHRY